MSHGYRAVQWNAQKRRYDFAVVSLVVLAIATFAGVTLGTDPDATIETALIRGLGVTAFASLHIILLIGPLTRLDPRFLPLLYNRRHLGVVTFLIGLAHATFVVFQYHALGDLNPIVSVLVANPRLDSLPQFPFELLGVAALAILFIMAATSHDFWLANLSAPTWKRLHMLVYVAWGLLVAHVALGFLQDERDPLVAALLAVGVVAVATAHIAAAARERRADRAVPAHEGWVEVCGVDDIEEKRGRMAMVAGERVAVFRYDGKISCVSNVCQHQNGPLGEGRIVDGLIVCPWHGFQYCPHDGRAPAPFTERLPTFDVRIVDHRVLVRAEPHPAGTPVEPARVPQ